MKAAKRLVLIVGILVLAGHAGAQQPTEPQNPGPITPQTLEIIQNASEIFVYAYQEKVGSLDIKKDILSVRRLTDRDLIANFKRLLGENATYQPQYKKRCLPVWDYGLEFRDKNASRTFLFSFRCDTMKINEEKVYRDFTRERTELFALFKYEVNDLTSETVSQ